MEPADIGKLLLARMPASSSLDASTTPPWGARSTWRTSVAGVVPCGYHDHRYNGTRDSLLPGSGHTGRVRRRGDPRGDPNVSAIALEERTAEAGPDQPGALSSGTRGPTGKPVGGPPRRPARTAQHSHQRPVPDLFPVGERPCLRGRNHGLPLAAPRDQARARTRAACPLAGHQPTPEKCSSKSS